MTSDFRLDIYDLNGDRQFMLTDFLNLAYSVTVNTPATLSFKVDGTHSILSSIQDKWEVEIWRRPKGKDWNREAVCMFRDISWEFLEKEEATLTCEGIKSKLGWRIVNWAAGTNNRSAFVSDPTETIMKTLVEYNCGPSATTGNGRKRTGTIAGLTVETDNAGGTVHNWYCHGKNVLTELQSLALVANGDYDLVKTGPNTYEFRWYSGQLGTDRSTTTTFAMKYNNMGQPTYTEIHRPEKTVACVWGQGEGAARDYVTRTGADYSAGNDIEVYVDARDVDLGDTTGLNSRGDERLREYEAVSAFTFTMLQTPSALYGVNYFLGDLIRAVNPYNDTTYTLKIQSVTVTLDSDGNEKIEPDFSSIL